VSRNSRFFVAAGIAIAIAGAGHLTQASAQATAYQPPAKRVSPAQGFARQKSSLPTPRAADGHPDLTGVWVGGFPSPAGPYTVRRMGTFEPDQAVMQRGVAWNKPIYKPEYWEKVRSLDFSKVDVDPAFRCLPAGVPRIEVTFLIDANGILNVSARDVRTGDTQSLAVKPSYGLSDDEVERMIGESFKFAADDLKARQLIEARTEAETIIMATEKAIKQGAQLVGKEDLSSIRASMAAVEAAKSGTDHKAIRAKMADLEKATHHLAEVLMDTSLKEALENKKLSELTSKK